MLVKEKDNYVYVAPKCDVTIIYQLTSKRSIQYPDNPRAVDLHRGWASNGNAVSWYSHGQCSTIASDFNPVDNVQLHLFPKRDQANKRRRFEELG
jgi:hypothetical protein